MKCSRGTNGNECCVIVKGLVVGFGKDFGQARRNAGIETSEPHDEGYITPTAKAYIQKHGHSARDWRVIVGIVNKDTDKDIGILVSLATE